MERKKKKLSFDHQDCQDSAMTADERETIQRLFSKKFVYSQSRHWTLKSTTVFGCFTEDSSTVESCDDVIDADCKQHKADGERKICCSQSQDGSDGDYILKAHMKTSASSVKDCEVHLSPLGFDQPGSALSSCHLQKYPTHSHNSESCYGLQGNTDRIQQRAAHLQRQLERVVLPPAWHHKELMGVKETLNTLKDKLSDKEMIEWHQHTNSTNLAGKVVGAMKSLYNAELCTQAWCKFHEILAQNEVVPASVFTHPQKFNSIHLCEAPGAFITSLNHYLVSRGMDTHHHWCWLGTTLNPYYEGNDTGRMISDDRFIRTTFSNWFFGHDNSGDLMSVDNMVALMDRAAVMGDIHLITADGSIDCQENPAEQEVIVSRLHHCEVLSSCILLAPGGTLVIKLFTMLEASSIALLYFLNCTFEKVTVCKPATSKSGNSEVYTVCSGYTAPLSPEALLSVFSTVCASSDPHVVLLPQEDIPPDFMEEHIKCCLHFCRLQSDTISENLALYGAMEPEHKRRLLQLQDHCVSHYISVCKMDEIDDCDRIRPFGFKSNFNRFSNCRSNQDRFNRSPRSINLHTVNGIGSSSISLPLGRLQGTFQQRQQHNQFPWQQLLAHIHDYCVDESCGMTIRRRQVLAPKEVKLWRVMMGQAFSGVASSHFCDSRMLGDLHLLMTHAQVRLYQQKALAQHSSSVLTDAFRLLHTTCFFSKTGYDDGLKCGTITAAYHLALEGSVTSFWLPGSPELSALSSTFPHHRLSCVEDLQRLAAEEGPVGVVVDLTQPSWLEEEEVQCQGRLLEVVRHACSYLPQDSTLVLILPVALTRLTAGLLYIFASLFRETSFAAKGKGMFLHQTLCFYNLTYLDYALLRLLETWRNVFALQHASPSKLLPGPVEKETDDRLPVSPGTDCSGEMKGVAGTLFRGGISDNGENELHDDSGCVSDLTNNRTGEDRSIATCHASLALCRSSASVPGGHEACSDIELKNDGSHVRTVTNKHVNSDQTNGRVAGEGKISSDAAVSGDKGKALLLDGGSEANTSHAVPRMTATTSSDMDTEPGPPPVLDMVTGSNSDTVTSSVNRICQDCPRPFAAGTESHLSASFQGEAARTAAVPVNEDGGGRNDGPGGRVERSEVKKPALVPLEVVPVLEIINDVTFTRFLQASNKLSIGSFVSCVKAAELDRLASEQTIPQNVS